MKKVYYLLFISFAIFSSCSKTDKLSFSEFEIKDENGVAGIFISETGEVKINGENAGKLNRDGILEDSNGELLAKITDDNHLQNKEGKNLIKIDENGKMDNGSGLFIEWSEDGQLLKGGKDEGLSIHPIDEKSYQAASIILYLYLSFQ